MDIIKHEYFGEIVYNNEYECYLANKVFIPHFNQNVLVKLVHYDEDFEPINEMLSVENLDDYAQTFKNFLADIQKIYTDVLKLIYDNYLNLYAKYYEKPFEVIFENSKINTRDDTQLHQPLAIDSKEKHYDYIEEISELEISNNKTVIIKFSYLLDAEHGLEVKIKDNKVLKAGGLCETLWEE